MNLREIDALVAEKIMGLHDTHAFQYGIKVPFSDTPNYSTDISAAWEVVEKLKEVYQCRVEHDMATYECEFSGIEDFKTPDQKYVSYKVVKAKTPSLAICLAALKSVGVEV